MKGYTNEFRDGSIECRGRKSSRGNSRGILVGLAIGIGFLNAGCNGKVNQCKNLIQVVNQTVVDTSKITEQGTNGDPTVMDKLSERYAKSAQEIEGVNISEERLKSYQSQFASMYKNASQLTKEIGESIKSKKLTQVLQGNIKLQKVISPEKDLANGITQFCQAEGGSEAINTTPSPSLPPAPPAK